MIESAHRRAFKIASDSANLAMEQGDFELVDLRTSQMHAIAKLEQARREIFSDVPDLPEVDVPPQRSQDLTKFLEGLPRRLSNAILRHNVLTIEELEQIPDQNILRWKTVGKKSLAALRTTLADYPPKSG